MNPKKRTKKICHFNAPEIANDSALPSLRRRDFKKEVVSGQSTATASCRSTVAEQSERVGFLFKIPKGVRTVKSATSNDGNAQCYKQPGVSLYAEDCLETLRRMSNGSVDLLLQDTPFGCTQNEWDVKPPYEYFIELFRVSKNQVIWGANYFKDLPECRCFLIWDKVAQMDTMADCEFAWTSFDKNAKIFRHVRNTSETRIHICQKPIKLYEWILSNYAEKGQRILDTHLGSGSSRIAADKNGLEFVGFEVNENYFKLSEKRFNNYKSQLRIEGW